MRYIHWACFWLGLFAWLSVIVYQTATHAPKTAESSCIENDGIPIHDSWGKMVDCKLYLPTKN